MAELLHRPQARRSVLGRLAGAGTLFLLGACQIIPDPGAPISRAEPPPPPRAPRSAPTIADRPPPPPATVAELRNNIAVLVPLSGENAGVGTSIANAANLALLDSGDTRVRITVYDTARGAAAAANEALAEGSRLFLGPLLAEDVREVAPIARGAGVPVLAFSNDVTVAGNGVYLLGFDPGQSIERVVRHARAQGVQRFAGLTPNGVYGQRSSQALIRAVEASGGRMVAMQSYDRTPAGLRAAVTRLNGQSGYDAVLIADSGRIAATAAQAVRNGPSAGARILGTELWKTEANLPALAPLRGAWFAAVPDTMFDQLRTRYRSRYRTNPYRLASLGYDAVLLTVRASAGWPFGQPFPQRVLRETANFQGIDGAFRFGSDNVAERALEVQQVDARSLTTVSEAPRRID
jgi:ABC-type branched-subunit amino acid transport system substrate-binding protein